MINAIYLLSKDIWRDVWESAASSAALGGALTGIVSTTRVLKKKDACTVNKAMRNLMPKVLKGMEKEEYVVNLEEFEEDDDWEVVDDDTTVESFSALTSKSKNSLDEKAEEIKINKPKKSLIT